MAELRKGITQVEWKNKDTKRTQVRYRVRVMKSGIKYDQLFDTIKEAEDYLNDLRSTAGIAKRIEYDEKKLAEQKAVADFLSSPPFSTYVNKYIEKYIKPKNDGTELKQKNESSEMSRLKTILETEVDFVNKDFQSFSFVVKDGLKNSKKKIKDFKLEEIDDVIITNYIHSRMKSIPVIDFEKFEKLDLNHEQRKSLAIQKAMYKKKKIPSVATVKREVDTLQGIFTKIRYIDKNAYITKLKAENPCATADLTLLKGWQKPRKVRIKPELEELIVKELKEFENPEMLLIFALAMTTGMRRSEILFLKWSQINYSEGIFELTKTKNGQDRSALLTDDAREVLKAIPKKDDRLFHYTIDGYNTMWQKFKKKNEVFENVNFHDTRREFISKVLKLCGSTIVVADSIGMTDIRHFEKSYVDEGKTLSTQDGVMQSIGHLNKRTTQGYFTK
jgi:integrase